MISPTDDAVHDFFGTVGWSVAPGDGVGSLRPGVWHDIDFNWDADQDFVMATVDGKYEPAWTTMFPEAFAETGGPCYLVIRLKPRSKSASGGILIERVSADVKP
jgi:hypothetical protein